MSVVTLNKCRLICFLIENLADVFLYSYEAEFILSLLSMGKEKGSRFNLTHRYIDDVLSIIRQLSWQDVSR